MALKKVLNANLKSCYFLQTGKLLNEKKVHSSLFNDMQKTVDDAFVITASSDETAKLIDV